MATLVCSAGARNTLGPKTLELKASLAPAEAEVGAVAKADQQFKTKNRLI